MKLKQRLILFFFITLFSTGISVYLLSNQIFLEDFAEIEDNLAYDNLERIAKVINEEIESLHSSAIGWATWDELYDFMKNRDQKFLKRNFEMAAFFEAHFDEIFLVNSANQVIYSRDYDIAAKKFREVSLQQMELVHRDLIPYFSKHSPPAQGLFIGAGDRPYLAVALSILPSSDEGSPRGYMVVLREIDEGMRKEFSSILKLNIQLSIGNAQDWASQVTHGGYLLKGPDSMQGIMAVHDLVTKNNLVVRLDIPRTIYNEGRKTIFSFLLIIETILTVSFGLVFIGFHKDVLSKILSLKKNLSVIGSMPYQSLRIHWTGKDEIAELTQNINEMLERLENSQMMANRASKFSALGEMAGNIAHEINNPLAIIIGFCNRLTRSADKAELNPEEVRNTADRILKTAYRIERIIKSLRLVSRDGERDPKSEVVLGDILTEVISLSDNKLHESGVELRVENFDTQLKVQARFVQLVQVILNLLTNSIDALESVPEKWIELRTEVDDAWIHIYFTDSGFGIPSSITEKIMDPFFTTKEPGRGTGLGLSISKGIIESHGGQFALVKSEAHTCFKISLPR
jgi:signal transduction histidine kinase